METQWMRYSAKLISCLGIVSVCAHSADQPVLHIKGHYSDNRLKEVHTLILPRIFLYDANNHLVPDGQWPTELASFRKHKIDDEHCCLAYYKTPDGGPPTECATWMNYDSKGASWAGLMDANGAKVDLKTIPAHKWLVVEYAASWCAPCVVQEQHLNKVFATLKNASEYAWITIDMTKVPNLKDALRKKMI